MRNFVLVVVQLARSCESSILPLCSVIGRRFARGWRAIKSRGPFTWGAGFVCSRPCEGGEGERGGDLVYDEDVIVRYPYSLRLFVGLCTPAN
jgi:hypothetical protein